MPGLVDTQMAKGEGLFWVEPVNVIAKEIISAIEKKKTKQNILYLKDGTLLLYY